MDHCQETPSTGGARPKIEMGENMLSSPKPADFNSMEGTLECSEVASSSPLPVVEGEACESDKDSWKSDFEWRSDSGSVSDEQEMPGKTAVDFTLCHRDPHRQHQARPDEATNYSFGPGLPDPLTVSLLFTRDLTFQLNRKELDSIMDKKFPLTDRHINLAAEILKKHFSPKFCINGVTRVPIYDSGCILPSQVDASYSPAVSFHWAENHWTVSVMEDCVVYYLDSDKDRKSKQIDTLMSVAFHLGQLYTHSKCLDLKVRCTQQIGKLDCGPLSIAQAVEFCHDPKLTDFMINFNQAQLRSHLKLCFENRSFSRFPKLEFKHTKKIL